jgi:hypothetical protein
MKGSGFGSLGRSLFFKTVKSGIVAGLWIPNFRCRRPDSWFPDDADAFEVLRSLVVENRVSISCVLDNLRGGGGAMYTKGGEIDLGGFGVGVLGKISVSRVPDFIVKAGEEALFENLDESSSKDRERTSAISSTSAMILDFVEPISSMPGNDHPALGVR